MKKKTGAHKVYNVPLLIFLNARFYQRKLQRTRQKEIDYKIHPQVNNKQQNFYSSQVFN